MTGYFAKFDGPVTRRAVIALATLALTVGGALAADPIKVWHHGGRADNERARMEALIADWNKANPSMPAVLEIQPEGAYNEIMALNGIIADQAQVMSHVDDWGGPTTFPHYAIGWAWAGNAPFQWTKQIASHFGGTRNGMVVHWPNGIKSKNEIRSQFTHATDIAPTVMEAAGLPFPKSVNGTEQIPFSGTSFLFSFDDAKAIDRHTTQYFEMFGNRAIYHDGWVACTRHSIPWLMVKNLPLADDVWELYNVNEDFSEANNLASSNPEKLKELK